MSWETQLLIYGGGEGRETTEGGGGEREEARRVEPTWSQAVAEKKTRTKRNVTEKDTEGRVKASASTECKSRHKEGHMTNIYLTDSNEEFIADFVKDHEELCNQTQNKFKDNARKDFCGRGLQAATNCHCSLLFSPHLCVVSCCRV